MRIAGFRSKPTDKPTTERHERLAKKLPYRVRRETAGCTIYDKITICLTLLL
jgi:hypothetical protein